jgi:hypothetical protein
VQSSPTHRRLLSATSRSGRNVPCSFAKAAVSGRSRVEGWSARSMGLSTITSSEHFPSPILRRATSGKILLWALLEQHLIENRRESESRRGSKGSAGVSRETGVEDGRGAAAHHQGGCGASPQQGARSQGADVSGWAPPDAAAAAAGSARCARGYRMSCRSYVKIDMLLCSRGSSCNGNSLGSIPAPTLRSHFLVARKAHQRCP